MHRVVLVLTMITLVCSLAGCAAEERATDAGLPEVTRLPGIGGRLAISEVDGRAVIITGSSAFSVSGGIVTSESPVPAGFTFNPATVFGDLALLGDGERRDTVFLWDIATPDKPPVKIVADHEIVSSMLVDLVGDSEPELVVVTSEKWRNTGSPRDNHERIEVWSLQGEPSRVYLGDFVATGRVSHVGDVHAVDVGLGDPRPELVWRQVDATNNDDGDARLVVIDPCAGFATHESASFDRRFEIVGTKTTAGSTTVHLAAIAGELDEKLAMEFSGAKFRRVSPPNVEDADLDTPVRTAHAGYGGGSYPPVRTGLRSRRIGTGYGQSVEFSDADGQSLLVEPSGAIRHIGGGWLVDLNGDGSEELVVIGNGDELCKCTSMGFIGWSAQLEDGSYGEVTWSKPLEGGIAGLAISDVDGEPGEEIVVGALDHFCQEGKSVLWIFSPSLGP